jgi:hypothetical protein
MTGSAQVTFTQDDMITAQRAWWMGTARWQTFVVMAGVIALCYLALVLAITWHAAARARVVSCLVAVAGAVAITVIVFAIGYLMAPRRARRAFREHKALAGEFTFAWDAEAITINHALGSSRLPWTVFHGWLETPDILLLYQTRALFNMLPKRAVPPDAVDAIVARLRAAGVPERRRFGFLTSRPMP